MKLERDTQKSKLYKAENVARKAIGDVQFTDKLGLWAFVEKVERDQWFRRKYGIRRINVTDGRGRRNAGATVYGNTILMPRWSRTPIVTLHEIAHLCAPREVQHGWQFAATMLELVRHFLGADVHRVLRQCFRDGKVRYKKPQTRIMTEAQKQALRERFARLRPAGAVAARQHDIAIARGNQA